MYRIFKKIVFVTSLLLCSGCVSLESIQEESGILLEETHPMVSLKSIERGWKRLVHKHDLSLVENKDFNLLSKLNIFLIGIEKQIRVTQENIIILQNNRYILAKFYNSQPGFMQLNDPEVRKARTEVNQIDKVMQPLKLRKEMLVDIKEELTMLIEKLMTIQRVVEKKLREEKEKKAMTDFSISI